MQDFLVIVTIQLKFIVIVIYSAFLLIFNCKLLFHIPSSLFRLLLDYLIDTFDFIMFIDLDEVVFQFLVFGDNRRRGCHIEVGLSWYWLSLVMVVLLVEKVLCGVFLLLKVRGEVTLIVTGKNCATFLAL